MKYLYCLALLFMSSCSFLVTEDVLYHKQTLELEIKAFELAKGQVSSEVQVMFEAILDRERFFQAQLEEIISITTFLPLANKDVRTLVDILSQYYSLKGSK